MELAATKKKLPFLYSSALGACFPDLFRISYIEISIRDVGPLLLKYATSVTASGGKPLVRDPREAVTKSVAALMGVKTADRKEISKEMERFKWYTSEKDNIFLGEPKFWDIEYNEASAFIACIDESRGHVAFLAGAFGSPYTGF